MNPRLLLCVVCILASPFASVAEEYWVDQRHALTSDENSGRKGNPWKTVGKAAATLQPGDTVVVRPGIYRERVAPKQSGMKDKPIVYRAEGPGVVLSGAEAITGWQRCTEKDLPGNANSAKIWWASAGGAPSALFVDGVPMVKAREPNRGWWIAEGGDTHTLVDSRHLVEPAERWLGSTVFFWDVSTTTQGWRPVTAFDPKTHTLKLSKPIYRDRVVEPGKDRYYLENNLAYLDRPGEFVVISYATSRVYFWPPDGDDPNDRLVEAPHRARFIIEYGNRKHLRFEGFEIRHGAGHGIGSWSKTAEDITIANCWLHHNLGTGLYLHVTNGLAVKGNLVAHSHNGVSCSTVTDAVIEANEIADNAFDGLVVGGGSDRVVIRRNFIHGHNLWGHPDNIQFHGGLENVTIEENVILDAGQAIMMEQCDGGVIRGNVIVGSEAVAVICGHRNVHRFKILGNTIAFTGYGPLSCTGTHYEVRGNILYPGAHTACMGIANGEGFRSDYNLLYKPAGLGGPFAAFARNWPRDMDGFRKVSGQDAHSICADPQFVNAPVSCIQIDNRRLFECTASKLIVRGSPAIFAVGDHVEVKFDGVVRRVKAVGADHIEIDPPLKAPLDKAGLVLNWKDKASFALDLRLRPTSPARGAGEGGADLGANLDIAAFARGDVDGDGKPDIRRPQ